jgi:hypothetical protein
VLLATTIRCFFFFYGCALLLFVAGEINTSFMQRQASNSSAAVAQLRPRRGRHLPCQVDRLSSDSQRRPSLSTTCLLVPGIRVIC